MRLGSAPCISPCFRTIRRRFKCAYPQHTGAQVQLAGLGGGPCLSPWLCCPWCCGRQARGLPSGPPQVPLSVPRGDVKLQAAPLVSDLQAAKDSGGGPWCSCPPAPWGGAGGDDENDVLCCASTDQAVSARTTARAGRRRDMGRLRQWPARGRLCASRGLPCKGNVRAGGWLHCLPCRLRPPPPCPQPTPWTPVFARCAARATSARWKWKKPPGRSSRRAGAPAWISRRTCWPACPMPCATRPASARPALAPPRTALRPGLKPALPTAGSAATGAAHCRP